MHHDTCWIWEPLIEGYELGQGEPHGARTERGRADDVLCCGLQQTFGQVWFFAFLGGGGGVQYGTAPANAQPVVTC